MNNTDPILRKTIYEKETGDIVIYHISYPSAYWMNATMMRISEIPNEVETTHSHEELMDALTKATGEFTYFEDYQGYSLNADIIRTFYRKFKHTLSKKEMFLKRIIEHEFKLNLHFNCKSEFHLIITHRKDAEIASTINHELCHALYAHDDDFVKEACKLINTIPPRTRRELKRLLLSWGYNSTEFKDELTAYMSSSSESWIIDNMLFDDANLYVQPFRAVLNKYADVHGMSLRKLPPSV